MKSLLMAFLFVVVGTAAMRSVTGPCYMRVGSPRRPESGSYPPRHVRSVAFDDRSPTSGREAAEDLPVPIVRGSRVTRADFRTPSGRLAPRIDTRRTIAGRLSATEERARADARLQLQREVTEWLTPEVPTSWKPPAALIDRLIVQTRVKPVVKDYGTLYEATQEVDFSSERRLELLRAYQDELVAHRLGLMGGGLGFILISLAGLAGYIRADEATKGYYTHWLRAVATAGVGASGVLIYQLLA